MSNKHIVQYNIKYCALQFLYWMLSCSVIPFTGVFLLDKGYSNSQIGIILAGGYMVGLLLQPLTAYLADHLKEFSQSSFLIIWCCVYLLVIGALLFYPNHNIVLSILYVLYISLMSAMQPHINSFVFYMEKTGVPIRFGMARGFGSLSWGITSLLLGVLVTKYSPTVILYVSAAVDSIMITLLSSIKLDKLSISRRQSQKGLISFFCGDRLFLRFMLGIMLIFFGFSFIDGFPYQIVLDVGGDYKDMSRITSFLALIEIPAMFGFEYFHKKFGCIKLLIFSAIIFALRGIFLASEHSLGALYFSNMFHLFSYSIMIPASVRYLSETVPEENITKAQAMLTMMMSIGSILSSFIGGWLIDNYSVRGMLSFASVITIFGCIAVIISVKRGD